MPKSKKTKKQPKSKPFICQISGEGISIDVQLANSKNIGAAIGDGIARIVEAMHESASTPSGDDLMQTISPDMTQAEMREAIWKRDLGEFVDFMEQTTDEQLNQLLTCITQEQLKRASAMPQAAKPADMTS